MSVRSFAGALALLVLVAPPADAQLGRLGARVKQRAEQAVDRATDKALDRAEAKVKCAVSDTECIDAAKAAGKEVELTGAGAGTAQAGAPAGAGRAASLKPGEGAWANYDFVPGDRVIFAEDFTKERVGNFPRRLELQSGNGEVVEWNGGRWLRFTADRSGEGFYIQLPEALPQRFTMEMDITIPWSGVRIHSGSSADKDGYASGHVMLSGTQVGFARKGGADGSSVDPRTVFADYLCDDCLTSRPIRVRLHADGRYFKLYLEDKRVGNIPNLEFERGDKLFFTFNSTHINGGQHPPLITNLSINAGGKELYDALMADGRVATQGIYFDTGSDRIRPESSGTLSEIAQMLKEHADLKLVIEGHTDNVGAADANQGLSEKRAAAVKAALTGSYGIDAARLESKGLGASKPAAANDSAEGRQQNRRVELVKA